MFDLAAATANPSTTDRLSHIPLEFWWKLGAGIAGLVLLVVVLRKVARMNKVVLAVVVLVVLSFVGFNWVYERNEPDWASPAVSWLAGFFPSKGKVQAKH